MNYNHYLKIASDCAKNASYNGPSRVKLGCIAVYHGTILAKGWNSDKTHTDQARYNHLRYDEKRHYCPSKIHAEIEVLARIKYLDIDFSKVTLFIYREFSNGTPALARPCISCENYIKQLQIGKIVYTTENGYAIEKFLYSKNKKKKKK